MIPAPAPPPRHYAGPAPIRARTIRAGADIYKPGDRVRTHGRDYEIVNVYRRGPDYIDYAIEEVVEPALLPAHSPTGFSSSLSYLSRLWHCARRCL